MVRRGYVVLCVVGLFLLGCDLTGGGTVDIPSDEIYDVTETDVYDLFDQNLITSEHVTVRGVALGDNLLQVFRAFGTESYMDEYPDDRIVNVRYVNDRNRTSVIFHLVNGSVERMAIKDGMRDELVGRTAESNYLHNITRSFGKPDASVDISDFRIYTYNDKGLEIYHRRKHMFGFGLIRPS